jgi:hypothetical protein
MQASKLGAGKTNDRGRYRLRFHGKHPRGKIHSPRALSRLDFSVGPSCVTKIRFLSYCKRQNDRFQDYFHRDRQPLRIYESGATFEGSNLFEIYEAGANELCFQMLGLDSRSMRAFHRV